jgi:hypothetical protein
MAARSARAEKVSDEAKTRKPSTRCCTIVANAPSKSSTCCTGALITCTPSR